MQHPITGPSRAPAAGGAAKSLVIMLHGLGADGQDLIGLADHWAAQLPHTAFVAPNAPEPCDMAPMGHQWFSLQNSTPAALLDGARGAAPVIDTFIDEQLAQHGLDESRLMLVGFSQGTMMSLFVALRRARPVAGVLGYSGALIGGEGLSEELVSRPPVMLVHGDADDLVPVDALHRAVGTLGEAGLAVEWHICSGVGHGIDPRGLTLGLGFIRDRLTSND